MKDSLAALEDGPKTGYQVARQLTWTRRVHTIRGHVHGDLLLAPPADWGYAWIVEPRNSASALRNFGAHLLHTLV